MKNQTTDYSNHLVLYSGGADSTFFIAKNLSAKHLIHYPGQNEEQTKTAVVNANILNRYLTVEARGSHPKQPCDGETNLIHALYDTQMAIEAGIKALSFGMRGIVMCFNADDIGIDFDSISNIFRRTDERFELLTPLRTISAKKIRSELKSNKLKLHFVSCMHSTKCGFCAKCRRGY